MPKKAIFKYWDVVSLSKLVETMKYDVKSSQICDLYSCRLRSVQSLFSSPLYKRLYRDTHTHTPQTTYIQSYMQYNC